MYVYISQKTNVCSIQGVDAGLQCVLSQKTGMHNAGQHSLSTVICVAYASRYTSACRSTSVSLCVGTNRNLL